jgi:hypothetical protein
MGQMSDNHINIYFKLYGSVIFHEYARILGYSHKGVFHGPQLSQFFQDCSFEYFFTNIRQHIHINCGYSHKYIFQAIWECHFLPICESSRIFT